MKRKCNFITALVLLAVLTAGIKAVAGEKTKKYHESWAASGVQTLKINNKFGDINVTNKGGNEVTIDVLITVETPNEKRAGELLDQINVSFDKTGNTVSAETHISSNFKSRQEFSIDYEVNIPTDKNLDITNKYGNTFVNLLNAGGTFDIQYGNFSANELNAPVTGKKKVGTAFLNQMPVPVPINTSESIKINLAYAKADVSSANDLSVTVQYSNMNLGVLNHLNLNSKYTVTNIEKIGSVKAESKYDTFNFGNINSLQANTKYTHIKINELLDNLNLDAGYGGIKVNKIANGFKNVNITSSYGQVSLGLNDANYSIEANCTYCGVSYPENRFSGDRVSENHSRIIKGKVGNGSGGEVFIKSRYGEIKLN